MCIRTQQEKALAFYELHHNDRMLILPNIWNPLGARLLQDIGYPAVATASAAIAFTNGYDDGEQIPFDDLLKILKRTSDVVNIPVTADIESGYSDGNSNLRENIEKIIETGIVGINIEDSDKQNNSLNPIEAQCENIRLIREVAESMGISLFVNARIDVFIKGNGFHSEEEKLFETIKRGKAYIDAGADCIFPIAVKQRSHIHQLTSQLKAPINILAIPGAPDIKTLKSLGVTRVSLGPGFLKIAVRELRDFAMSLINSETLDKVIENDITSDYLKNLVNKK